MIQKLEQYLENIQSDTPTIASIMSRETFFDCINKLYGLNIFSKEEIAENALFHIYYYSVPPDKKEFSIATVREAIVDTTLRPIVGKNFFVFDDFDTASLSAQNAILKLLEDCPPYAVIFLLVKNPKNLIGTIKSRTISFFENDNSTQLSDEIHDALERFFAGDIGPWMSYMYKNDFGKDEVFAILTKVFSRLNHAQQKKCQKIFLALEKINERPKNLLENFFL